MNFFIIAIAYIFVIYMFYNLYKIRKEGKNNYNKVYFSIVMIFVCFAIWGILRNII